MALSINPNYIRDSFLKLWNDGIGNNNLQTPDTSAAEPFVVTEPFRCFALPNFIEFSNNDKNEGDDDKSNDVDASAATATSSSSCKPKYAKTYLDDLREELELLELQGKKNDLYNFRQSDDLHNVDSRAINAFKDLFNVQVKQWLQRLTGIVLDVRVAMTASAYTSTDYLLCHDDELEKRRIAFAFYLTPGWTASDGGRLDLFSSDDKLRPQEIVHSIVPRENTLSFFEVTPKSFHQVSEVTSPEKTRWSINGWFHGAAIERPPPFAESAPERTKACFVEFDDLLAWINPDYIDPQTQAGIREQFGEKSEIQLNHFLQADRYEAVISEMGHAELSWTKRGPWNRRNYLALDGQLDPDRFPNLSFCFRLMQSEAMYLLISQFTDVRLHPLYEEECVDGGGSDVASGEEDDVEYVPPAKKKSQPTSTTTTMNGAGGESSTNGASSDAKPADVELIPCEIELRKFIPGSYTLLSDADFASLSNDGENAFALDAQLCFTESSNWDTKHGGYTCYIEADSSEELLTVMPSGNSLSLVFREPGTQRFVKYLNHNVAQESAGSSTSRTPYLADICAVYYEANKKAEKKS